MLLLAAVPRSSLADGDDPDYTAYLEFDLTGARLPVGYTALP